MKEQQIAKKLEKWSFILDTYKGHLQQMTDANKKSKRKIYLCDVMLEDRKNIIQLTKKIIQLSPEAYNASKRFFEPFYDSYGNLTIRTQIDKCVFIHTMMLRKNENDPLLFISTLIAMYLTIYNIFKTNKKWKRLKKS